MSFQPVKMNAKGFNALDRMRENCTKFPTFVYFEDSSIAIAAIRKCQVSLGHQFNCRNKRETRVWATTQNIQPKMYAAEIAKIFLGLVNGVNPVFGIPTVQEFYDDVVVPFSDTKHKDSKGFKKHMEPLLEKYGHKNLTDFQKQWISFLLIELAKKVSAPTQARYLARWVKFFNLAIEYDFIESNPCKGIPRPRENPPRDRVLSLSEVTALVEAALSDINPVHACCLLFCLFSGLRQGNVISLRLSWFNENYSMLSIPDSKSGKPIYMALNSALQSLIKHLLPYSDGTYLFPSSLSTPSYPKPMGKPTKCLARLVERVQAETGITEHFHCHDLRRTHASQMLRVSGDIRLCQQALGHADIKTTQRYAYHSNPELLAASEQTVTALLGGCELELFNPATEK